MRSSIAALIVAGLFTLACGGGSSTGKYGSIEFTTYKWSRSSMTFNAGGTVTRKWANMSGSPVKGEWTQTGDEIEVQWSNADNYSERVAKFKRMGPCSMAQYYSMNNKGETDDDGPWIYEQTKPLCNTIEVR